MSENLKDILSNLNPGIDQETLLLYLQGKLSPEQQHEVEKGMLADEFDQDALEGLGDISNGQNLLLLVEQLKDDLKKKTEKKKKFRQKLQVKIDPSIIIAVVIVLLLVVLSFFVIAYYNRQ